MGLSTACSTRVTSQMAFNVSRLGTTQTKPERRRLMPSGLMCWCVRAIKVRSWNFEPRCENTSHFCLKVQHVYCLVSWQELHIFSWKTVTGHNHQFCHVTGHVKISVTSKWRQSDIEGRERAVRSRPLTYMTLYDIWPTRVKTQQSSRASFLKEVNYVIILLQYYSSFSLNSHSSFLSSSLSYWLFLSMHQLPRNRLNECQLFLDKLLQTCRSVTLVSRCG